MYYVIMDLEWNNSYNKKLKCFFNEIIEIGAVMADEDLEVADTFSVLIRSQLSNKLSGRVKNLTHISNEDMYGGVSFGKAISDFTKWLRGRDCIFMSWGNSDLRVLCDNLKFFSDIDTIPFMSKYMDLQKYCQSYLKLSNAQQVGLSAAASLFDIDVSEYSTHRALDDSLLSLRCLKKSFDPNAVERQALDCDSSFYQRLFFKAKNITNIHDERIDRAKMVCYCDDCHKRMSKVSDWKSVNQSFRALFYCKNCESYVMFTVRFKEYFDHIEVKSKKCKVVGDEKPADNSG
ncbi:MAG: exonuclease domain-containing protein [Clostridiales bacterium]|nr:exonuclease domain-containing protein [Clostridiales bacterium]MCD7827896.1 exonuclease domain-containing protein [Clostridiales bacterium]